MSEISTLTPLEICRFLCGIAWADGEVADRERDYILNLAQLLGLTADEYSEVERLLDKQHDAEMYTGQKLTDFDRKALVRQALILARADGETSRSKTDIIEAVESLLELTEVESAELRTQVAGLFAALPEVADTEPS